MHVDCTEYSLWKLRIKSSPFSPSGGLLARLARNWSVLIKAQSHLKIPKHFLH